MSELTLADPLDGACKYCAPIARAKMKEFFKRALIPREDELTATVTFIKVRERTYAVTARHVTDGFERNVRDEGEEAESYFIPINNGRILRPSFVQPPSTFIQPEPDIVVMPIPDDLPSHVGKKAFEILDKPEPEFPLSHSLAVGFPTSAKSQQSEENGSRMQFPCVFAVAEGTGTKDQMADQLQFLSEINEPVEIELSGMSGGPVFWSKDEEHGLLGFVKEAHGAVANGETESLWSNKHVQYICQRAKYEDLIRWTNFALQQKK